MVSNDKSICQNCGSKLKRYDKVSRIVRTKGGKTSWIEIERFRCPVCGQIHRELPDYIFPYAGVYGANEFNNARFDIEKI